MLQIQYGWQNTGYKKLHFLLSALKQNEVLTEKTKKSNYVYRPFGCRNVKDRIRYMHCNNIIALTKEWQELRRRSQRRPGTAEEGKTRSLDITSTGGEDNTNTGRTTKCRKPDRRT